MKRIVITLDEFVSTSSPTLTLTDYSGNKGLYAYALPDLSAKTVLSALSRLCGYVVDAEKFHITVMYSKDAVIPLNSYSDSAGHILSIIGVQYFRGHDDKGYLSFVIDSDTLKQQHQNLIDLGAKHSFDDYTPHITIFSGVDEDDVLHQTMDSMNSLLEKNPIDVQFSRVLLSDMKD